MARPSKLTDVQWEELGKKILSRKWSNAHLAREYGISKGLITQRFGQRIEKVTSVAKQIIALDDALELLNPHERLHAMKIADDLRSISGHLAGAARHGAATAHRLAGIAHGKTAVVDEIAPLEGDSGKALRDVAALTGLVNESAKLGLNLLSANKAMVEEAFAEKPMAELLPVDPASASRAYQQLMNGT